MKLVGLILISVITTAKVEARTEDFCKNAFKAVCTGVESKAREEAFRTKYKDTIEGSTKGEKTDWKAFYKSLENAATSSKKVLLISENVFKKAIKESVPDSEYADLRTFVDGIEIMHSDEADAIGDATLTHQTIEVCGTNGFNDNGFSFSNQSGKLTGHNTVVLCRGHLLSAAPKADLDLEKALYRGGFRVITHEMGHIINNSKNKPNFEKYLGCLKKNSPQKKFSSTYEGEVLADFWSTQAIAQVLSSNREEALEFLQQTYAPICASNTKSDKDHPDTKFRIEYLLRRNPQISKAMGCSDLALVGCTLSGAVSLKEPRKSSKATASKAPAPKAR